MNTISIVSQLINKARMQFGDVTAVAVPEELWERAMDEVADAGGEVGLDHCVVDGVRVHGLKEDSEGAVVHLGTGEMHELSLGQ